MQDDNDNARVPLIYQPAYEFPEEDENESIAELKAVFVDMAKTVAAKEGHAHRAVHSKGQGLLKARLNVVAGLSAELAQGIFSTPAGYDALVRISSPPAEQLPDSVSTPRAIALKVLAVAGERVPESADEHTQDFLMVNGPAFVRPGPKGFLRDSKLLAKTTEKAPRVKEMLSSVLRGVETVIEAVGGDSSTVKSMGGQPNVHPLGETYFTQVPFKYGPYMAKFSLKPRSPALLALKDQTLDADEDDAQRNAVNAFFGFQSNTPAEWELQVQLCTDIEKMPLEDASVEWDQQASPYRTVAILEIASQAGWEHLQSERFEDAIAFSPWHAIEAHRPLGAINRARREVMQASRQFRSDFNRCPIHEPQIRDGHASAGDR